MADARPEAQDPGMADARLEAQDLMVSFPVAGGHGRQPGAIRRGSAGIMRGDLLFERNKRLVTVNEYWLPEAIELEIVGLTERTRQPHVRLIVVHSSENVRLSL